MVECEFFVDTVDWGWFVGFNRYMVECECSITGTKELYKKVLIDTWWNVNQSFGEEQLKEAFVLIDTWWNVNLFKRHIRQNP